MRETQKMFREWFNSQTPEEQDRILKLAEKYISEIKQNKTKMGLELTGKIKTILPLETGEGKNGTWKKRQFVLDFKDGNYDKICAFIVMGDKVDKLNDLIAGQEVKVSFNISSREYNGRYYTEAGAWKIEKVGSAPQGQYATGNTASDMDNQPQIDSELPF